jgi:CRP-like cAMP-binding protein
MHDLSLQTNRFLRALPEEDRQRLLIGADLIEIKERHSFYSMRETITHAYFLLSGMSCFLIRMRDGRAVDTGSVGVEGFVGLPLVFGGRASIYHCIMQLPGSAWKVRAEVVQRMQDSAGPFRDLCQRYAHARYKQAAQSAACNLLHTVEQRFARWLLTSQDHCTLKTLPLTHELISEMLGANRSTVSLIAEKFDHDGLIQYRHGQVKIQHRERLLHAACECYGTISQILLQSTDLVDVQDHR